MASKPRGVVTPDQKAEQQIDALRALYDLFINQLKEIVRTEIADALEGKSKAVGTNDATAINATEEAKGVFTEKQASEMLHVSIKTLYNLRESGKLSYVRIGSRVLYRRRDIEEFLESQARPAKKVDKSNRAG